MNRAKLCINIRDSFWFLPTIYGIIAIILVFLINIVDAWLISSIKDCNRSYLLHEYSSWDEGELERRLGSSTITF